MPSLVSTGSITIADVNDGSSVYTASIYIQQVAQPATPSGGSYNFSSKVLTPPSGWTSSLPAASTTPTWVAVYTFSTITPSVAVTATSWGTPALFVQNGVNGNNGTNGLTAILSNESHVFPASSSGVVSSYLNSGTDIRVYEGGTELIYDGIGTSNGTWKITSASSNLTVGTLTDQGAYLTIGAHSGVADATDLSSATYTITGKNSAGISFTLVKVQSFTKSKSGANGSPGAQGPTVRMTYDRPPTFSSTDGVLDANQASITFSLLLSGITASSYSWTFVKPDNTLVTLSGVTVNAATCTISQANFIDGDATRKSLKVVCVVNGVTNYTDSITITRLEKSTAAAGATVGASWGSNISNQPTTLSGINSTEGNKLSGIESGATVGANSSNLSVGLGTNLVKNSDFYNGSSSGWSVTNTYLLTGVTTGVDLDGWYPIGGHAAWIHQDNGLNSSGYIDFSTENIAVKANQKYEFQCKTGAHRCKVDVFVYWYKANGAVSSITPNTNLIPNNQESSGGTSLSGYKLCVGFGTSPADAVYARLVVRKNGTIAGYGYTDSWAFFTQAYFGEALANQTEASTWSAGGSAGAFANLGQINSSNASTYIANAAIGSAQIGDAAITNAKIDRASVNKLQVVTGDIQDLAVSTLKIQGNAVVVPVSVNVNYNLLAKIPESIGSVIYMDVCSLYIDMLGGSINSTVILTIQIGETYGASPQDTVLEANWTEFEQQYYDSGLPYARLVDQNGALVQNLFSTRGTLVVQLNTQKRYYLQVGYRGTMNGAWGTVSYYDRGVLVTGGTGWTNQVNRIFQGVFWALGAKSSV